MKKTIIIIALVIVVGMLGYFLVYDAKGVYLKSFSEGRFEVFLGKSYFNGLCGDEKIFDKVNDTEIATIKLCEDNIKNIEQVGDSVEITTDRGKKYSYK